ncbi:flavin-containing monooxygenase [Chachezhania antarctica]|uniref:flavin-containing monooxygenase n=1 Tax=Chachezhania antarctica TaxID=2340860 RepID=UPI000EB229B1|nr:NAD(P)/FAD-dependent oxidoreductase [Chachezhania antarctica]|tara:strand:- start:5102 stop:6352 length:1251 start_codon:yes stop_codon:yes gene_type:complete
MSVEKTDVLVVGGGQAGVAMSEHLGAEGIPHIVLERGRIAESWRTKRWDSLVANGPAWHDRFPGLEFSCPPNAFAGKEDVAAYMEAYAEQINSPLRTGVDVTSVTRLESRQGFRAETSAGPIEADYVIAATGPFHTPLMPDLVPETPGLTQMHSIAYRNPGALPDGAVLVVGAGSSGVQIAAELRKAGRDVYLSVGPHGRPPRSYRGRDYCWWLGVLNKWDAEAIPGADHVTIAVSGAEGGHTVDFRALAATGITLVGRTQSCTDGKLTFSNDLAKNIARGDRDYLAVLDEADAFAKANGLDLPEEPEAREILPDPDCLTHPLTHLDLAQAGVTTIIWATGFALDYSWLKVNAFDANGKPKHLRGITDEPGVYFLGLPWQTRRASSFIYGVWHDARYITDHIVKRRAYLAYPGTPG